MLRDGLSVIAHRAMPGVFWTEKGWQYRKKATPLVFKASARLETILPPDGKWRIIDYREFFRDDLEDIYKRLKQMAGETHLEIAINGEVFTLGGTKREPSRDEFC